MDFREDNMKQRQMLEKIAELDYSQSHLRDLNAKMRHWLDVADDEMAVMRSENAALSQQVKTLEKIISDAQKVEAKTCRSLLANDFDAKRCSETEMQTLEEKYTTTKEQNKKLSVELKSLKQERDRDKINSGKFKDEFQNLEFRLEQAQLGLQHRDEVIHQKDLQLQHSEEMVEEYESIIKDLRLANQKLRMQLEDRLDEASFTVLNDVAREKEGPLSPPLSFAEELMLLASSDELESIILDPTDLKHEETGAEELMKSQSLTIDPQTKRCAGTFELAPRRVVLFLLFVFILAVLLFVASGGNAGNLFSMSTIWSGACLMLQPYWSVHYDALPPI